MRKYLKVVGTVANYKKPVTTENKYTEVKLIGNSINAAMTIALKSKSVPIYSFSNIYLTNVQTADGSVANSLRGLTYSVITNYLVRNLADS